MYGSSGLGHQARSQLAAWEAIAEDWGWWLDDDGVARCAICDCGIFLACDAQRNSYQYTGEQRLALIVLHLRTHHEDLDPNG